jgi:hypothetical protein
MQRKSVIKTGVVASMPKDDEGDLDLDMSPGVYLSESEVTIIEEIEQKVIDYLVQQGPEQLELVKE